MTNKPPLIFTGAVYVGVQESLAIARKAEELGLDGVVVADHLFMPDIKPGEYPYSSDGDPPFPLDAPWPDVWSLCSAIAAVTDQIEILTCVYILPLRHPLIVARAAGTAAILSEGRLTVGVGVGWLKEEFDALDVDFSSRGSIADEAIEALRALWGEGPVTFAGRHFSFGPLYLEPAPTFRIPIAIGGTSEAALRRAVRLGDGYIVPHMSDPDAMFMTLRRLGQRLAKRGRAKDDFRTCVVCTARDSVEELCRFAAAGADVLFVRPWRGDCSLAEKLDALERFAGETVPVVHERLGCPPPRPGPQSMVV
jgi:probable F420-dependent oxidoreductase